MCEHFGWSPEGISRSQFGDLVNNDDDTSDDELRDVLLSLQRFHRFSTSSARRSSVLPWQKTRSSRMSVFGDQVAKMDRKDLMASIFSTLCAPAEHLDSQQLRIFAERTGFDGDDEEWAERFDKMSEEFAWKPPGKALSVAKTCGWLVKEFCFSVSQSQFEEFLGDEEESSDDELRRVLLSLRIQRSSGRSSGRSSIFSGRSTSGSWKRKSFQSAMSRDSLIEAIFKCLDSEHRQVLSPDAIRIFAEETGFEGLVGDDEEWQNQFQAMAEFFGWEAKAGGISQRQFADLVNDDDSTDLELRQVLENLQVPPVKGILSIDQHES
eukprot:Skav233211  [mRNA]  locus=scaffold3062:487:9431:- [translate_table: standard]